MPLYLMILIVVKEAWSLYYKNNYCHKGNEISIWNV